jgi:hypothetical protein
MMNNRNNVMMRIRGCCTATGHRATFVQVCMMDVHWFATAASTSTTVLVLVMSDYLNGMEFRFEKLPQIDCLK